MSRFDELIGKLTDEQTKELALLCLDNCSDDSAMETIVEWAKARNVSDELIASLEAEGE